MPGEKGQYGYVRLIEEKGRKIKKQPKQDSPPPLDLFGASGSTSSVRNPAPTPGNLVYPIAATTDSIPPQSASISVPGTSHMTVPSFEESQEGSEWAIRIGDAPPPAWGKKRSLPQEDLVEDNPKRKRIDSRYVPKSHHPFLVRPNRLRFFVLLTSYIIC